MPAKLMSTDGATELVNFDGATQLNSREALCVYLKNFDAYKLYTSQALADTASRTTIAARDAGVPVVRDAKAVYEARYVDATGKATRVWVLQSERQIGQFFQLAKQGQVSSLTKTIKANGAEAIARSIRGFEQARDYKLTDPQGFFDPAQGMPVRFMDIHTGANPDPRLQEMIDALKAK